MVVDIRALIIAGRHLRRGCALLPPPRSAMTGRFRWAACFLKSLKLMAATMCKCPLLCCELGPPSHWFDTASDLGHTLWSLGEGHSTTSADADLPFNASAMPSRWAGPPFERFICTDLQQRASRYRENLLNKLPHWTLYLDCSIILRILEVVFSIWFQLYLLFAWFPIRQMMKVLMSFCYEDDAPCFWNDISQMLQYNSFTLWYSLFSIFGTFHKISNQMEGIKLHFLRHCCRITSRKLLHIL